ncbi:MAG: hypothetical protein HW421_4087 [Ignavibacteria bacterium]|nr:hypothetical protein [Ignavibacteria bacterium]
MPIDIGSVRILNESEFEALKAQIVELSKICQNNIDEAMSEEIQQYADIEPNFQEALDREIQFKEALDGILKKLSV